MLFLERFDIGTLAANHTKEFEKAAATPLAHDKALVAARCLSVTAADVFINQDLYKKAVAYFKKGKAQ